MWKSGERAFQAEGTLNAKTLNPAWHVLVRVKKGSLAGSSEAGDEYKEMRSDGGVCEDIGRAARLYRAS